jgi:hypothetical protein
MAHRHLDYRVSPLRGGPVMTGKNQNVDRNEINNRYALNRTAVGLALPSTSFAGRDDAVASKFVDGKAKPWDDERAEATGPMSLIALPPFQAFT